MKQIGLLLLLWALALGSPAAQAQPRCRSFPETGPIEDDLNDSGRAEHLPEL